jgi:hypothetical protein
MQYVMNAVDQNDIRDKFCKPVFPLLDPKNNHILVSLLKEAECPEDSCSKLKTYMSELIHTNRYQ